MLMGRLEGSKRKEREERWATELARVRGRVCEDGINAVLLQGAAGYSEEPKAEQADSDTQGTHATVSSPQTTDPSCSMGKQEPIWRENPH